MRVLITFLEKNASDEKKYDKIIDYSKINYINPETETQWRNFINTFSHKKDSNFFQICKLDEFANLWFYNKFRLFHSRRKAFFELLKLQKDLNNEDSFTIQSAFLPAAIFVNSINITVDQTIRKHPKKNYYTLLKFSLLVIYRYLISKKSKKTSPYFLHGFISNEIFMPSSIDMKDVELNSVWGYIGEKNNDKIDFIEDIAFPSIYQNFQLKKRFFSKKYHNTFTNEYIFGRSFLSSKTNRLVKQMDKEIHNNLTGLFKTESDLGQKLILLELIKLRNSNKLHIRKYLAYKKFFSERNSIKNITTYGENLSQGKIILDAAKQNNIRTIALQHGMISYNNMGYNYSLFEASFLPMPHVTCVWGKHWQDELIKVGNYPLERIVITGQQRTDIIPKTVAKYKRKTNLITFFTQPQPYEEERRLAAESFVMSASQQTDFLFVFKLHPKEEDDIYSSLIKKYKVENCKIEHFKNTYQLLAESCLIMTCYSTVGIEALYFKTPLIVFDSAGKDSANYIKEQVGHWVKNSYDLNKIIKLFAENELMDLNIEEKISQFAFKIDGNATNRIMNFIVNQ